MTTLRAPKDVDRRRLKNASRELTASHAEISFDDPFEANEFVVRGMSESDLRRFCRELELMYAIKIEASPFQVVYFETIRRPAEGEDKYIREVNQRGHYAHVKVRVEPLGVLGGIQIENAATKDSVPDVYVRAIEAGIINGLRGGVVGGYRLVDLKAVVIGGSFHETDSNEMAFEIAASMAVRDAARKADPVIIEPIMRVEVVSPEEWIGTIIGDMNRRRGRIHVLQHREGRQVITVFAPLSELIGYENSLAELTDGSATHAMEFETYEEVPPSNNRGEETAGVPARKPKPPTPGSASAAEKLPN